MVMVAFPPLLFPGEARRKKEGTIGRRFTFSRRRLKMSPTDRAVIPAFFSERIRAAPFGSTGADSSRLVYNSDPSTQIGSSLVS
eukprot:5447400-Prymnesium_polylepis.1